MLCNFTQFCLAARRFSSSLICLCSWMHKGIFQCQGNRLTLLWEGNSQTEKRLRFFCICQERGFRGSRLREGWSGFAEVTPLPTPMSNWRAVMGTSQMQGLTENFELTSTESLEFLVSLIYVAFSHQEYWYFMPYFGVRCEVTFLPSMSLTGANQDWTKKWKAKIHINSDPTCSVKYDRGL